MNDINSAVGLISASIVQPFTAYYAKKWSRLWNLSLTDSELAKLDTNAVTKDLLTILKIRLANEEITKHQYEELKKILNVKE